MATPYPFAVSNITNSSICLSILFETIPHSHIRILDVVLVIPSAFFLIYLLGTLSAALHVWRAHSSLIGTTLYLLVFMQTSLGVLRYLSSIVLSNANNYSLVTEQVFWLILRFATIFVEIAVLVFGLASAHLDSQSSVRRVLSVSSVLVLLYSGLQTAGEFLLSSRSRPITEPEVDDQYKRHRFIYRHGGEIFLLVTSLIMFVVYSLVLLLPFTPLRRSCHMPSKIRFYAYCFILAIIYLPQAIGAMLLLLEIPKGLCLVTVFHVIHCVSLSPLVYFTFLQRYFGFSWRCSANKQQVESEELLGGVRIFSRAIGPLLPSPRSSEKTDTSFGSSFSRPQIDSIVSQRINSFDDTTLDLAAAQGIPEMSRSPLHRIRDRMGNINAEYHS